MLLPRVFVFRQTKSVGWDYVWGGPQAGQALAPSFYANLIGIPWRGCAPALTRADFCSKHQQSTTILITTLASRIVVLLSFLE